MRNLTVVLAADGTIVGSTARASGHRPKKVTRVKTSERAQGEHGVSQCADRWVRIDRDLDPIGAGRLVKVRMAGNLQIGRLGLGLGLGVDGGRAQRRMNMKANVAMVCVLSRRLFRRSHLLRVRGLGG